MPGAFACLVLAADRSFAFHNRLLLDKALVDALAADIPAVDRLAVDALAADRLAVDFRANFVGEIQGCNCQFDSVEDSPMMEQVVVQEFGEEPEKRSER